MNLGFTGHLLRIPTLAVAFLLSVNLFSAGKQTVRKISQSQTPVAEEKPAKKSVEELAELSQPSMVSISQIGKNGQEESIGSGFVISTDGLVATSLHVIGEARPVSVQLPSGKDVEVTEVYAWDRQLDLAVVRVAATNLSALKLGDSAQLKQGTPVVAIGNPLGLKYSIVQGVVSAQREIEGVEMVQLAIPIESGNSGGPMLDMSGHVQGVLTMKHTMSQNLGFAMPVNALKLLLEKPNPVSMERWLSVGRLNPKEWTPLMGARWSRRPGRIEVEGVGNGFGGRSICLYHEKAPREKFELSARVRLDDEAGAAGLIFGGDEDQRHYGFYPTGGQLRLTRFDGPTVYSWTILKQAQTPYYQLNDWNTISVQYDKGKLRCYVNSRVVFELDDIELAGNRVGLAKFRDTRASFRSFRLGSDFTDENPQTILSAVENLRSQIADEDGELEPETIAKLQAQPELSRSLLSEQARKLENEAARLRQMAVAVHRRSLEAEIVGSLKKSENQMDLTRTSLLLAKLDNPDVDIEAYTGHIDEMAQELKAKFHGKTNATDKLHALRDYLFKENGFHGCHVESYYRSANSYLNEVIDNRVGLPISLSILFIELAAKAGLEGVTGVPLPGHFVVGFESGKDQKILIDVFENGKLMSREEAAALLLSTTGSVLSDEHLEPATKQQIILRMLRNLLNASENQDSLDRALSYLNVILALEPDSSRERLYRASLYLRLRDRQAAKEDLKHVLEQKPGEVDLKAVQDLYDGL